jgi:RHS repeat-associated protein
MYDGPYQHALLTHKFTGKERDSESGLDNFGARYDSSSMGRFMTPDPLMASARVWDPQTWNRYSYSLNNPLMFIDPTGMKEVTADECKKDPHCTTLNVNVIYDKNAGLTDKQKADFEKTQLQYAKDEYGNADIHLNVTFTPGAVSTDDKGNTQVSGTQAGALNVVVTDRVIEGRSGISAGGVAASFIPANSIDKQELAHEIAHHLAGDTQGWRSWIKNHDPDYSGNLLNAILDAGNKTERIWMNTFDTHSGAFSHYPLASAFNHNARVFQKMIQPTTKPQ